MMSKRTITGVNAGSMADIAFLLLIFFMMTATIEKDKGIARSLPADIDQPIVDIKTKNLFDVRINKYDELYVEDEILDIKELRMAAIAFIDNGGAVVGSKYYCDYCEGQRDPNSSDHPDKAIVSIHTDRSASYKTYIAVQNEIAAAYNYLRDRESLERFGWKFTEVKREISEGNKRPSELIQQQLHEIQNLIPYRLVEAELKHRAKE